MLIISSIALPLKTCADQISSFERSLTAQMLAFAVFLPWLCLVCIVTVNYKVWASQVLVFLITGRVLSNNDRKFKRKWTFSSETLLKWRHARNLFSFLHTDYNSKFIHHHLLTVKECILDELLQKRHLIFISTELHQHISRKIAGFLFNHSALSSRHSTWIQFLNGVTSWISE